MPQYLIAMLIVIAPGTTLQTSYSLQGFMSMQSCSTEIPNVVKQLTTDDPKSKAVAKCIWAKSGY